MRLGQRGQRAAEQGGARSRRGRWGKMRLRPESAWHLARAGSLSNRTARGQAVDEAGQTRCSRPRRSLIESRQRDDEPTPPGTRADYRHFHAITDALDGQRRLPPRQQRQLFLLLRHRGDVFPDDARAASTCWTGRCAAWWRRCIAAITARSPSRTALTVGLRVAQLGGSSIRYEIAVFREDEDDAAAEGHFVHVLVDARHAAPAADPGRDARETATDRRLTRKGGTDMDLGFAAARRIVCAASKGLGRACAMALAREGVDWSITARTARDAGGDRGGDPARRPAQGHRRSPATSPPRRAAPPRSPPARTPTSW